MSLRAVCRRDNLFVADQKALTYCRRQNRGHGCVHLDFVADEAGTNRRKTNGDCRNEESFLKALRNGGS